jgi:cytochrome c-type biogenesis protein CcmH/NrfG
LAQLLWKVPGPPLSIGNKKKALEEARLGTVYDPSAIDHWLHLGQIAATNKDYATARMALEKALSLPDDPEDPSSSQDDKADARAELAKIAGK